MGSTCLRAVAVSPHLPSLLQPLHSYSDHRRM